MLNESELIKKAVKGDEKSFAQIVDLYKNYVFAIILNFVKDYSEVENIAQEVFLQVYLSLPAYKANNFKGWIGRIATNKSIDWLRKKRSKFKEEVLEEELLDSFNIINTNTPEELLIKKEREREITKLCKSIPPIYEETIVKFYLHGKSYEEIAREEGVTVKTIASRLYRGKNMLREKWREHNETL
ncbi:MAG: sigma-70 family RNA polymerase sigma factor [Tissierellia bacterium]|nr:sigma-70 family RNA polymerase sigma factor [Tissierellia bacterium]